MNSGVIQTVLSTVRLKTDDKSHLSLVFLCVFFFGVLATQLFKNMSILIHLAQLERNCLPMQQMHGTQAWSLGREDHLKKEVATCSSIIAWKVPWTEEPRGLQSMGLQRVGHDWAYTYTHTHTHRVTHWYENNYTLVWELGLSFWLFYNWLC